MRTKLVIITLASFLFSSSCQNRVAENVNVNQDIQIRFELDSAGNITDPMVKQQLVEIAEKITKSADRILINSYTEKMISEEQELTTATQRAYAAKAVMYAATKERVYYSVAIQALGYENAINIDSPSAKVNRRIEIQYLD